MVSILNLKLFNGEKFLRQALQENSKKVKIYINETRNWLKKFQKTKKMQYLLINFPCCYYFKLKLNQFLV